MTSARRMSELVLPWSGLIGALAGWAFTHQFGSDLAFAHCDRAAPWLMLVFGCGGIVLALGGGLLSFRQWRRGRAGGGARHFVSLVGMMAALLFSTAILWQTLASLLIPRCFA